MFQVRLSSGRNIDSAVARLRALGVDLDAEYGAVPINAEKTSFIVRGTADEQTVAKIETSGDVSTYPDAAVEPLE
jgi:hypothetical protein